MSKRVKTKKVENPFEGEVLNDQEIAHLLSMDLKKGIDETKNKGQSVGSERLLIEPFPKSNTKKK